MHNSVQELYTQFLMCYIVCLFVLSPVINQNRNCIFSETVFFFRILVHFPHLDILLWDVIFTLSPSIYTTAHPTDPLTLIQPRNVKDVSIVYPSDINSAFNAKKHLGVENIGVHWNCFPLCSITLRLLKVDLAPLL